MMPRRRRHATTSLAAAAATVAGALGLAWPTAARAQQPVARDTLRLGALQSEAMRRDPRGRQLELLASQSALRLRSLEVERLPSLRVSAQGQYQSDVLTFPLTLPGGTTVPAPPRDTYDAHVEARERLYDPTREGRRDVERARLAESEARVRVSLHGLRQNVNDAYFTVLRLQAQRAELEAAIADLAAQRRVAAERVSQGAALPSESAILDAETLRRRQSLAELDADRDAALVVLGDLAGRTITAADALALPELGAQVAAARAAQGVPRERPEYAHFARSRESLERERVSVAARDLPRVSAFARAGYGRPGLDPLARDFDTYWLGGVMVEWTPWNWGATRRDREVLALEQEVVATEEAAFTESLRRGVARDLASIDRLERSLGEDDAIIALRDQVLGETRLRFGEGVVTSAEYVDRETDVLAARLARASHRVELAQARARFLTTIGVEVP